MYKNKIGDKNNISGPAIKKLRLEKGWSQRELADILQLKGLDVDKNAIQRIEARKRFVTDIELYKACARRRHLEKGRKNSIF